MTSADRIVRDLERRALGAAFLGECLRTGGLALLLLGTLALALRATLELTPTEAALLLTPLGLVPGLAFWLAWRRRPSRSALVAWLDARAGGDGSLVTAHEVPDERWSGRADARADRVRLPALTVAPESLRFLGALGFTLTALLVPLRRAETPGPPPSLFESTLERLRERLALLDDLGLEEELSQDLGGRLERLAGELDAGDPETTFEALDRLSQRLGGEGARLAEHVVEMGSELARGNDPKTLAPLLSRALQELDGSPLLEKLPEELRNLVGAGQALQAAGLSPARLLELSAGMRELLGGRLLELSDAGLLDPSRLAEGLDALQATVVEHECDARCKEPGGT